MSEWFATYRQLKTVLRYLAFEWEKTPHLAEQAYALYALPDRVESLPPNATERDLWAAVRQAIQDGKEDAEMWAKERGE